MLLPFDRYIKRTPWYFAIIAALILLLVHRNSIGTSLHSVIAGLGFYSFISCNGLFIVALCVHNKRDQINSPIIAAYSLYWIYMARIWFWSYLLVKDIVSAIFLFILLWMIFETMIRYTRTCKHSGWVTYVSCKVKFRRNKII